MMKKNAHGPFFRQILKNSGFSLAEVTITSFLVGTVLLGVTQIIKNQSVLKNRAESDFEINVLSSLIFRTLGNAQACNNTLGLGNPISNGLSLSEIKNAQGRVLLNTTREYGNNDAIKISSMVISDLSTHTALSTSSDKFMGKAYLEINFEKLRRSTQGRKDFAKKFPLQLYLDSSNNLVQCYSSFNDAAEAAKEETCRELGGTYDFATGNCQLDSFVNVSGDTRHGDLLIQGDIQSNNQICIEGHCRTSFAPSNCAVGQVVRKVDADGSILCGSTSCSNGDQFFVGIDGTGNPVCRPFPDHTCGVGEYIAEIRSDGSLDCQPIAQANPTSNVCPTGKMVIGFDTDGKVECSSLQPCPAHQFYGGMDRATGAPLCKEFPAHKCPVGLFIKQIGPEGKALCGAVPEKYTLRERSCPLHQFVTGFDNNGSPICASLLPKGRCPPGEYMIQYLPFNILCAPLSPANLIPSSDPPIVERQPGSCGQGYSSFHRYSHSRVRHNRLNSVDIEFRRVKCYAHSCVCRSPRTEVTGCGCVNTLACPHGYNSSSCSCNPSP